MGVVWRGVEEFGRAVEHLDASMDAAARKASVEAGAALAAVAKTAAPHGTTGRLSSSIISRYAAVKGQPTVQVGPTAIYGRRNDLGFKGRKSARGVKKRRAAGIDTGRRGLQPTKGSHFMEKALDGARPQLAETFRRAWADAITKF